MARVLIIDDDRLVCRMLSEMIQGLGHEVSFALMLEEGKRQAALGRFDLVLLDIKLPDGNGLEAMPEIARAPSSPEVIIITGHGTQDGAELAFSVGAWDYLEKPLSKGDLGLSLTRALQYHQQKLAESPPVLLKREDIWGSSPPMRTCLELVARSAVSKASVLISGETGTGKELFARAIHYNSARAENNFVVVDCTALPETLVESMLFGHAKGAFTGADRQVSGLLRQADGGTLFLDEIGELPLGVQTSFLRVLQERVYRPVGNGREIASDFRLVAATNRELDKMVQEGKFRDDLLYRISAFNITLPPLRERREDIIGLTMHYLNRICQEYGLEPKGISPELLDALITYGWPGNIRELFNTLERALASAGGGPILYPKHLPSKIRTALRRAASVAEPNVKDEPAPVSMTPQGLPRLKDLREATIAKLERDYLQELMNIADGDIKESCRISGLSGPRLYALLKKYNIPKPRKT